MLEWLQNKTLSLVTTEWCKFSQPILLEHAFVFIIWERTLNEFKSSPSRMHFESHTLSSSNVSKDNQNAHTRSENWIFLYMSVSSFTIATHFQVTRENSVFSPSTFQEKKGGKRSSYVTQIGEKILTSGYEQKTVPAEVQECSLLCHYTMKLLWTNINYSENQTPSFSGQTWSGLSSSATTWTMALSTFC